MLAKVIYSDKETKNLNLASHLAMISGIAGIAK